MLPFIIWAGFINDLPADNDQTYRFPPVTAIHQRAVCKFLVKVALTVMPVEARVIATGVRW